MRISNWSATAVEALHVPRTKISVWLNGSLDPLVCQLLLQAVEHEGCELQLALAQAAANRLDVTPVYLYQLQEAGAQLFICENPVRQPTFLLLDDDCLLLEYSKMAGQRPILDLVRDVSLLQQCRSRFNQLTRQGRIPHLDQLPSPQISLSTLFASLKEIKMDLRVNPDTVELDQPFELSWEVSGAENVSISPDLGKVKHVDSKWLSTRRNVVFELTASNAYQRHVLQATVQVNPAPVLRYRLVSLIPGTEEELPLVERDGFPDQFACIYGQALRLYWEALQSEQTKINDSEVSSGGYQDITATGLDTFTFELKNSVQQVRRTIRLHVFQAPEVLPVLAPKVEEPLMSDNLLNVEQEVISSESQSAWERFKSLFRSP